MPEFELKTTKKESPKSDLVNPLHELYNPPAVQSKLEIGNPDDKYENETDEIADRVTSPPSVQSDTIRLEPETNTPLLQMEPQQNRVMMMPNKSGPILQMEPQVQKNEMMGYEKEEAQMQTDDGGEKNQMIGNGDEEEIVQRNTNLGESEMVQTKQTIQKESDGSTHASPELATNINSTKGQGSSLPKNTAQEMGSKMGADFSNVNIHTDSHAVQMNQDLGAKAFTHGNDIYFNKGNYSTESSSGKHLLSHELTHTMQQGGSNKVQRKKEDHDYTKTTVEYLNDVIKIYPSLTTIPSMQAMIPDPVIMQTKEFKSLMNPTYNYQIKYNIGYDEALYVCYLILMEKLKVPYTFVWKDDTEGLIVEALKTNASSYEESHAQIGGKALAANYQTLLTDLETAIASKTSYSIFEMAVEDYATKLWEESKLDAHDEQLFLSRVKARMSLKKEAFLSKDTQGAQYMAKLFEKLDEISRGKEDVNFKNATDRRILISGFDPFQGDPTNPSGAIAKLLDGQALPYTEKVDDGSGKGTTKDVVKTALIEAIIFPVKHSYFDKGLIEKFFDPYLNPTKKQNIFAIITISLDANSPKYNIERHAAKNRLGYAENEGVGTGGLMKQNDPDAFDKGSIETNVIKRGLKLYKDDTTITTKDWEFMVKATVAKMKALFNYIDYTSGFTAMPTTIADKAAAETYLNTFLNELEKKVNSGQQKSLPGPAKGDEFYTTTMKVDKFDFTGAGYVVNRKTYEYFDGGVVKSGNAKVIPPTDKRKASSTGSGGSFLSNEIYYRTSVLGKKYGNAVPNVHLHVPKVNASDADRDSNKKMAARTKEIIKRLIEGEINP